MDYGHLISWIDSPETLMQFAGPVLQYPLTAEQLDELLREENRLCFSVFDIISGECIGHAEIFVKQDAALLCRIIIGNKELRGAGLGQQVVNELLKVAFNTLDKPIAELNVYDWNLGAIRCYEKEGFTFNSCKINKVQMNGQKWISLNMILEQEKWRKQQGLKN